MDDEVKEPYSGEALTTKNKMLCGRTSYITQQFYMDKDLHIYCIDNSGYVHIVSVEPVTLDKDVIEFRCSDLKLLKKNRFTSNGEVYKSESVEDCFEYIMKNIAPDDELNNKLLQKYQKKVKKKMKKLKEVEQGRE